MEAKDTIEQIENERFRESEDNVISEGAHIANQHGINFTKFKEIISKGLTTKNDDDQWQFDYESYLSSIQCYYDPPEEWAKSFYFDRWNIL